MFPLFGSIPGGPELIILFVVLLFMLGIPLAFGVGLFLLGRWSAGSDDEVEHLRDRINTLESEVAAREAVAGDGDEQATGADDEQPRDADDADRER